LFQRMKMRMVMKLRVLLLGALLPLTAGLPNKFVDEGIADIRAITGAFAPNPRNNDEPMLFLSSKEGQLVVLEDPDNSDDFTEVVDFESRMCTNGERGLQSIRPHPKFEDNHWLYMYYSTKTDGCRESTSNGPPNRLSRFKVHENSLTLDLGSEQILFETSPPLKRMHNGGSIQFGNDGKIWITIGDGGSRKPPVSQDLGNLYGSVIRLNDDGTIPRDNPYADEGVRCGQMGGIAPSGKRCAEIYAIGLRNPFRLVMDPNTKNKVKFHVGDVGASAWEEISVGGTDYKGMNYGWPINEGPCKPGDRNDCPVRGEGFVDPFHYYEHTQQSEGGAVVGSAFVPDGLWPSKFKYLFIDFIFNTIYNLVEDPDRERRGNSPPIPGYRNETFHEHFRMVDMFFGPYKNTQALYYMARSDGQNVRRIRYTGSQNQAPEADIDVDDTFVNLGDSIVFDGRDSFDADGDDLDFFWDFGDGSTATSQSPEHTYDENGEYMVTLTITDERGQTDQAFVTIVVGKPPEAEMLSPAEGDQFFVGQELHLVGAGVDADSNALGSSDLFWEVRQHHASHFHPFLDKTRGNDLLLFPAPEPEDFHAATNSYLEVILYATDKDGLTTTISRRVNPLLVQLDVDSDPQGLKVLIDEFPVETPGTITTWQGHALHLDVEDQWPFIFSHWSDGGDHQHTIDVPEASGKNLFISAIFVAAPTSSESIPLGGVRGCTSGNKCGQCEGHCKKDSECAGSLICFKKGGKGRPVPGCIGIDPSKTDWCTAEEFLEVEPTSPTSPNPPPTQVVAMPSPIQTLTTGGQDDILLVPQVRDCTTGNECGRCEGHCVGDQECAGSLKCFRKGGKGLPVPGCIGFDNSNTDWCTLAEYVPGLGPEDDIPLIQNVVSCTSGNPCEKCEGHCQNDGECEGGMRCFMKGGPGRSVPGCIGTDNSNTDWCTDADF
jgi:glucose/arabinose dehydrogenase/PKD repeat protein